MPPLSEDAPQEVANVEGAALDAKEEEEEADESNEETPPTPGRHQHESSSSRQAPTSPAASTRAGESPSPTPIVVVGSEPSRVIPIDDDKDDLRVGTKRARASVDEAKAKKNKRQKAAEDVPQMSKASVQPPLMIMPLASMPPKESAAKVAFGESPPALQKQAALRFHGLPR